MYPVTLQGSAVELREVRASDDEAVFAYASDPRMTRYLIWDTHTDIETTRAFLAECIAAAMAPDRVKYSLAAEIEGKLVGMAALRVSSTQHQRGEIGYGLHPDWWGRGLGTDLARTLLTFGFRELGLHRIEATADPRNTASQRVLEKAGMRREGLIREHMLIRGRWRDSLSYAILETD